MFDAGANFFIDWFANQNAIGIVIAIVFGIIWLACYKPEIIKKPSMWAAFVSSAIITLGAISFIQIPLQTLVGQGLISVFDMATIQRWIYVMGFPQIALSGLVQEGAKLLPVVIIWRLSKEGDLKKGLLFGAAAGAGFGIFEAVWVHNNIFASGWSFGSVQTNGFMALIGFWERFFAVGFHTASTAIAAWGLHRGWGWQFYLIASLLHTLLNYSALFLQTGMLTAVQVEIYAAVLTVIVAAVALWLRWRKNGAA